MRVLLIALVTLLVASEWRWGSVNAFGINQKQRSISTKTVLLQVRRVDERHPYFRSLSFLSGREKLDASPFNALKRQLKSLGPVDKITRIVKNDHKLVKDDKDASQLKNWDSLEVWFADSQSATRGDTAKESVKIKQRTSGLPKKRRPRRQVEEFVDTFESIGYSNENSASSVSNTNISAPSTNFSASNTNFSAPSTNFSASNTNFSAPNATFSAANDSSLVRPELRPTTTVTPVEPGRNKTGPSPDETGPSPDETGPSPDETGPSPDETGPSPDETSPSPDETGPSPDETGPSPDETSPSPDETGPSPDETGPLPDETGPSPDETGPSPDEIGPLPDEAGPSPDETGPSPDETGPSPDETGPSPDETGPLPDETSPSPDESGPSTDESSPSTDESKPASGESGESESIAAGQSSGSSTDVDQSQAVWPPLVAPNGDDETPPQDPGGTDQSPDDQLPEDQPPEDEDERDD